MSLQLYILPTLKLMFVQTVLNILAYQILIVANVLVNSAALLQFTQCVTLLLIHVDNGIRELYLLLLVMGIHCTM